MELLGSRAGNELRNELRFAIRHENNAELSLLAFDERGACDLNLLTARIGVTDFNGAAAADLKTIVKVGAGGEAIEAEAGAGIVDFQELYVCARMILDGCVDVVRMTAGEKKSCGQESGQ